MPCHKDNADNIHYKGKKNILNNRCKKCEFLKSLTLFITRNYNEFALEMCCDVESSKDNEPEAILVNRTQLENKIAIEVKSFHQIFDANIKKDDREKSRRKHFTDKILDGIGNRVFCEVDKVLCERNISLTPEVSDLFLYGLLLSVYRDTVYEEKEGRRYIVSKPIAEEFLSYKGKKEQDFINSVADQVVGYIVHNILECLVKRNVKGYRSYHKFKIDNLNFTIGRSKKDSQFSIEYIERAGISKDFYPPREAFQNRINNYFKECGDKFSKYMEPTYKRILLITNESNYSKDIIIEQLKELNKPDYIDEVWCSFYVSEEIWNDDLEDFDGERIIDLEYVRVS